MNNKILKIFVCVYFFFNPIYSFSLDKCGENQVFSECASGCEPQCVQFKGEKCPPFQTLMCHQKCVCKDGYLRVGENECAEAESAQCGGRHVPSFE